MKDVNQERPRLRERDADELTAGIKARAARAKARASHRVSADDLLKDRETRHLSDSSIKNRGAGWGRRIRIGITAAAMLGVLGVAYASEVRTHAFEAEWSDNEIVTADLQSQLIAVGERVDPDLELEAVVDASDPAVELAETREASETVAQLQNTFAELLTEDASSSSDGAPSQGFLDSLTHREHLEPLFADELFLVDEDLIYTGTSTFDLAPDEIDPRLPWYTGQQPCQWEVAAVSADGAGSFENDVIWTCESSSASVEAWASAVWNTETKTFTSLSVGDVASTDAPEPTQLPIVEDEEVTRG